MTYEGFFPSFLMVINGNFYREKPAMTINYYYSSFSFNIIAVQQPGMGRILLPAQSRKEEKDRHQVGKGN